MFSLCTLELGAIYWFKYDHLGKSLSEEMRMFSFWETPERCSPIKTGWLIVHRLTHTKVMKTNRISRKQNNPFWATIDFRCRPNWILFIWVIPSPLSTHGSSVTSGSLPWPPFNPALCSKCSHSILCLLLSSHCWVIKCKSVPHLTMSSLKAGTCWLFLSLDHFESTWELMHVSCRRKGTTRHQLIVPRRHSLCLMTWILI